MVSALMNWKRGIMKTKKNSKIQMIEICSQDWILKKNPKKVGGYFSTHGVKGRGVIELGTKWKDKENLVNILIHEILEAIFVEDNKRYNDQSGYESSRDYLFVFDHDYLHGLGPKVGAALRSVGVLNDNAI